MSESKERLKFIEKHNGNFKFAGNKHTRVKQVMSIIKNTKSNPKNLIVVEGFWGLETVLKNRVRVESVLFSPELFLSQEAVDLADQFIKLPGDHDICLVSDKVFSKMSEYNKPDGLLAVCELPRYDLNELKPDGDSVYIILDGVEIPGNIGTILRTADGAGVDAVFVTNRKARLTHPKILKGSQGAIFSIPVMEIEQNNLIDWLKANGVRIVLTDTDAEVSYDEPDYPGNIALVAGSERYGIRKEWYNHDDLRVSIPMYGMSDSLNVAVSTSIILYQMRMKKGIRKK